MKRLNLIFLACFIFPLTSLGQEFGSVGSEWHYTDEESTGAPNSQYSHLKSVKDTTIQGETAHKITWKTINNTSDTTINNPLYVFQENDTVFMYSEMRSRFITFFIFNQNAGDTLTLDVPDQLYPLDTPDFDTIYKATIDSVKQDTIDGIPLKKFHTSRIYHDTTPMNVFFSGPVMERIGGLGYFLPHVSPHTPGLPGPIRCYSNSEINHNFTDTSCTFLRATSLPEINEDQGLTIYPNPVQNHLTIETRNRVEKLTLRDMQGKRLKTSESPKMNLREIEPGLYVLTIRLHSGAIVNKKVVKASGGSPSR